MNDIVTQEDYFYFQNHAIIYEVFLTWGADWMSK